MSCNWQWWQRWGTSAGQWNDFAGRHVFVAADISASSPPPLVANRAPAARVYKTFRHTLARCSLSKHVLHVNACVYCVFKQHARGEGAPKNLTHFSYTPSLFLNEVELHSLSSLSARVLWLIERQSPLYRGSWQRCKIYTFYCFYFVHGESPVKIHKLNCKYTIKLLNLRCSILFAERCSWRLNCFYQHNPRRWSCWTFGVQKLMGPPSTVPAIAVVIINNQSWLKVASWNIGLIRSDNIDSITSLFVSDFVLLDKNCCPLLEQKGKIWSRLEF